MKVLPLFFNSDIQRGDLAAIAPDGGEMCVETGVGAINSLVYAALFTDSRATDDLIDQLELTGYRGGAWSDMFSQRSPGSLLWTLKREKNISSTWQKARNYAEQALSHLIDTGYLLSFDVETGLQGQRSMFLRVNMKLNDNTNNTVEFGVDFDG